MLVFEEEEEDEEADGSVVWPRGQTMSLRLKKKN